MPNIWVYSIPEHHVPKDMGVTTFLKIMLLNTFVLTILVFSMSTTKCCSNMLGDMLSGEAPHIAALQMADLKEVRAKGIGKHIHKYKPDNWDSLDANVKFQGLGVLFRAWLFGILSVPRPVVTLSCKPDGA